MQDYVMVDAVAAAPTAAAAAPAMSISCSAEKPALASSEAHTTLAMISLAASAHEPVTRLPLEVVAVVDRSGSMSGEKMQTMKQTLTFLVSKGLQNGDSLAIVSFDDTVETRLELTTMDGTGKAKALKAIGQLHPGRTTNLSGGLLQGIDLLQRAPAPGGGSTRAVLLFTDGIANVGIRDGPGIVAAAHGAMAGAASSAPMTLFTFGFGSDHNEDMLRALADTSNGLYYFLDRAETIPQAFADCLGGLVAVVAQNTTLRLEPAPGVAIPHVHSAYKQTPVPQPGMAPQPATAPQPPPQPVPQRAPQPAEAAAAAAAAGGAIELSLGDVYAEEEKDLVLQLSLPALAAPLAEGEGEAGEGGGAVCLKATLRYYSVPASRFETSEATLTIQRPAATPAQQPLNEKLEEQRVRVNVAEAMQQAAEWADGGRLEEGRALLQKCRLASLASAASASPACEALVADLRRVETGYEDAAQYRQWGGKMSKMSAMSHAQQRSTHATGGMYENASKRSSKKLWGFSSSSK